MKQNLYWLRIAVVVFAVALLGGYVWYRSVGPGGPVASAPKKKVPYYMPGSKSGPIMVDEDDPRLAAAEEEQKRWDAQVNARSKPKRTVLPGSKSEVQARQFPILTTAPAGDRTIMSGSKSLAPVIRPAPTTAPAASEKP